MRRQASWAKGKPEEFLMLVLQSFTEAFSGKRSSALELLEQAVKVAERQNLKESAAGIRAHEALIEACFGNFRQGREKSAQAMALARVRNMIWVWAEATALALCGDPNDVDGFARNLAQRYPKDTLINAVTLPSLHGAVELRRGNPAKAIQALQPAGPYERAFCGIIYLRAQAYLKAGAGREAVAEFQKMLDHRGEWANVPWFALARLGLGRAWVLAGDMGQSRRAYQDFLALWKDADPDIPILQQAKAEYAKLQ